MYGRPKVLAAALGILAAGCGGDRSAERASDTAAMAQAGNADSRKSESAIASRPGGTAAIARRENLVTVTEEAPGMLAQAKYLPIDAQHLAQTKYPQGVVKSGTIRRRAGDLVYVFEIQQKDVVGTELVLVDAIDGSIVSTIHQDPGGPQKDTARKRTP